MLMDNYKSQYQVIMSEISKLFDARQKLAKLSFDDFSKYLSNNQLSVLDYLNLLREVFMNKRQMFTKYFKLLYSYEPSIIKADFKTQPLFEQLCKEGTLEEVSAICKVIDYQIVQFCSQNPLYACLQNQGSGKKFEKNEGKQIIKYLLDVDKSLIKWKINKSLLAEAIEKNQLESGIILAQRGADCHFINNNDENLLHLLYKICNKKNEKNVLELRLLLLENGVEENKINRTGRKPLDFCPGLEKKIGSEEPKKRTQKKYQTQETAKFKGKSEQGWEPSQKMKEEKAILSSNHSQVPNVLVKLQNRYDEMILQKEADSILQRATQQREKQIKKKKLEKDKEKDKQKKRVLTPDQLKYYLEEDIKFETQRIEKQNTQLNKFFNKLIEKLINEIKCRNNVDVEVFGSFATGLCLPESDIDMVIVPHEETSYSPSALLQDIHTHLETMTQQIEYSKFIKTASVPIIKIQCTQQYHGKKIDITFQDGNHNGRQSVKLIRKYLEIYPQLRSLTIILKQFIYSAQLSDPYSGGISSYGLIVMIVAYIQHDNRQRKISGNYSLASSAELLIGFLRYYGFKCNYIGKKICVLEPDKAEAELVSKEIDMNADPIYMTMMDMEMIYSNDWQLRPKLIILDPLSPSNNVGRATHKIRQIRNAFEMAYVCIHTNRTCGNKKGCLSYGKISNSNSIDVKYAANKRPCCIIKRMLKSTDRIII